MKKSLLTSLLALCLAFVFFACETEVPNGPGQFPPDPFIQRLICEEGMEIAAEELPEEAQLYIADNHAGTVIEEAEEYRFPGNNLLYGVELDDGTELLFDAEGTLVGTGDEVSLQLEVEDLPPAILNYLDNNYPDWMTEAFTIEQNNDYGQLYILVDFENGISVQFSEDGEFLCDDEEEDDEDEEEEEEEEEEPNVDCLTDENTVAIAAWLDANVTDYTIEEQACEDFCGYDQLIEVELEDTEADYYFAVDGSFLFTVVEGGINDLPPAIISGIQSAFQGAITNPNDGIGYLTYPDGSIAYTMTVRVMGHTYYSLIVDAAGNIVCQQEDEDYDDHDDEEEEEEDEEECLTDEAFANILAWLDTNIGTYELDDTECDDICDDEQLIEVELEDTETEYYFDLDGAFLFTLVEEENVVLPQAVLDSIEANYPGASIDPDDEIEILTYENGTVAYSLEITTADDDDLDLIIDENGNIICAD